MKQYFVMMIGLSGSGKSFRAKQLCKDKTWKIISSDSIREEEFGNINDQNHNEEVFNLMRKRTYSYLKKGNSVVYDATNVTIKNRKTILDLVNKIKKDKNQIIIQAYVMRTPFLECLKRNILRDRSVPISVIKKQRSRFQMPLLNEGFDKIILDGYIEKDTYNKNALSYFQEQMKDFDQQTHYHKYDLLTHQKETYRYYCEHRCAFVEVCSAFGVLLHDYGKLFTKTKNDKGEYSYYSHANVGTYELLPYLECLGLGCLHNALQFLYLINYHMLMFDLEKASTKKIEKYKKLFGERLWIELELLHNSDKKASKGKEEKHEKTD